MELNELLCGCRICSGRCHVGASRNRTQEIGFLVTGTDIELQYREELRRLYRNNIEVIDCIIIIKRIKQFENDKENYRHY